MFDSRFGIIFSSTPSNVYMDCFLGGLYTHIHPTRLYTHALYYSYVKLSVYTRVCGLKFKDHLPGEDSEGGEEGG